jgi:hypothetical protein
MVAAIVATKEHRRFARGLIEGLESRMHAGPPIHATEVASASDFLRQCSFSPASDYYQRLTEIQTRLAHRPSQPSSASGKRNYGGKAGGRWLQVQSIHDHVILSTCYEGEFNLKHGRVKISHRFNCEGRIDFVELKFLRSLMPCLTGEFRKLVLIKDYQSIRKDWHEAEAFTLAVLPHELLFLFADIFRCPKSEVLAWLINVGHRMAGDVCENLNGADFSGERPASNGAQIQLRLSELRTDDVARPILEQAAALESAVELSDDKNLVVRYHST